MFRIRRFGVIRTSNVVAFFYLVIVAVIFVPIAAFVAVAAPANQSFGGFGAAGALGVLFVGLLAAIFYGIFGWIFTALACLLYNFAARMIGGIEIQLEAVEPPTPVPAWGSANVPPEASGTPPPTPPAS